MLFGTYIIGLGFYWIRHHDKAQLHMHMVADHASYAIVQFVKVIISSSD